MIAPLALMQELHIPKGVYTSTLAVNSDIHGKVVDETYRVTGKHLTETIAQRQRRIALRNIPSARVCLS